MDEQSSDTNADAEQKTVEKAQDLVMGLWTGRLLNAAVQVGLFERLDDEPTAAATLADELDLDPDRSYRLLRGLGHHGVLAEDADRQFALTAVGELFQADHPYSLQDEVLFLHSPEWVSAMFHLPAIVNEGDPNGFVREFGCGVFEYMESNPEFAELFNNFMTAASRQQTEMVLSVLEEYDFSAFSQVCDVGGGHGHLLCHLLDAHPHLEGTVLDLSSVVAEESQQWAPKLGVEDRCTYLGGDMFEAVPTADAYFMKWILHDWSDEECARILNTIHQSAPPDGRLFIVESIVPGPETPHFSKRLDTTMMVHLGGRERTEAEYERLLAGADWELVERWDSEHRQMSVLEAAKA